jgi:sortase A
MSGGAAAGAFRMLAGVVCLGGEGCGTDDPDLIGEAIARKREPAYGEVSPVSRDQKLLKAGIFAMSVAMALTVAALTLVATLGDEPELAIAAEPAANVSTNEPAVRPDSQVKTRVETAEHVEHPPTVETTRAEPKPVKTEPPRPEVVKPKREAAPGPAPHPKLQPRAGAKPLSEAKVSPQAKTSSETMAQPLPAPAPQPELEARPDPRPERGLGSRRPARADAPRSVGEERRKPSALRRIELLPGTVMSLTIKALGIRNAPVRSSDSERALDNGVIHEPDTSLPWDEGAQRNVYLVGHRLGWPGTGSHRIFYNLDKLAAGDRIVLRDSRGRSFEYRVTDSLLVGPEDSWVKDVVPGRDMLSLQTCTPIPTFQKRLIVRADRV